MQSSGDGNDLREHHEVPKWSFLPRSPLCFRSLLSQPEKGSGSTGDHDDSISPYESSFDEIGLTQLRAVPSTRDLRSVTPIVYGSNDQDQSDYMSTIDRSATIPSEPWKNAQTHVAGGSNRMTGSYRHNNRNYELSILGQDLPPPPPSPSELLGFKSRDEKLLELTNRTGYNIEQRNGQRIYGGPPPGWTGPAPSRGYEIFVGKVPRDCYEDELVPIFEKMGRIYELRLMMDFSGSNRGYIFVRYTNKEDAKRAVKELNNYEIRPHKHLGVCQSVDNCRLWICGYPRDRTVEEITDELERMTGGVKEVELCPSSSSSSLDYLFVVYETHRDAALARRRLVPGKVFLFDVEITKVDWAEPEREVDEEAMSKVKSLFVRNVPHLSENDLYAIFSNLSDFRVDSVKKIQAGNAFVNFVTRAGADMAINAVQEKGIDLNVKWAKPINRQIFCTRKQLGKNQQYCGRPQQGIFSNQAFGMSGERSFVSHQRRGSHGSGSRYRASPHLDNAFSDPTTGRQFFCNLNVPPPPSTFFNADPEFFHDEFSYVPKYIMNSADYNEYSENAAQFTASLLANLALYPDYGYGNACTI